VPRVLGEKGMRFESAAAPATVIEKSKARRPA